MTLGELIAALETVDPSHKVAYGFSHPHSYRGFYNQLAFEPTQNVTVTEMLDDARTALGETYEGWKGGEYTMTEHTPVWLAEVGETGEELGSHLLGFMLFGYPVFTTSR